MSVQNVVTDARDQTRDGCGAVRPDGAQLACHSTHRRFAYIPELDGLRAVACILVILFHSAPAGMFSGGFIGVDIFFVLSGYLITSILMEELKRHKKIRIGQFYLQRSFRLIPALVLFLSTYLAVAPIVWPEHRHWLDSLVVLLYLSDYTYPFSDIPFFIRHTWSLAVEEQFYLLWPLILPFVIRQRQCLTILVVAWIGFSCWRFSYFGADWISYYYPFDTHCTGLIAGAALSAVQRRGGLRLGDVSGKAALSGLLLMAVLSDIRGSMFVITAAEAFSVLLIAYLVSQSTSPFCGLLRSTPMVSIGKLSYGLYLWHFPIAYYFRQDAGFLFTACATLILSFACALISYFTVERWGRMLKRKARLHAEGSAAKYATAQ